MKELLHSLKNEDIIYVDEKNILFYKKEYIYILDEHTEIKLKLPLSIKEKFILKNELSSRFFRYHIDYIEKISEYKYILIAYKKVYLIDVSEKIITLEDEIIGSRPLGVCFDGENIFYGEYINNKERKNINIFKASKNNLVFSSALTLSDIRHVHGIYFDKFSESYWITTGDNENECKIINWDGSDRIEVIKSGGQEYRAIDLAITDKYLYYGMDSPLEKNYIKKISKQTLEEETLGFVSNSVFFAKKKEDKIFFSTVCEPSDINDTKNAYLYTLENDELSELESYSKDKYPMKLFQYGQIKFINCKLEDVLITKPFSVKNNTKVNIIFL